MFVVLVLFHISRRFTKPRVMNEKDYLVLVYFIVFTSQYREVCSCIFCIVGGGVCLHRKCR